MTDEIDRMIKAASEPMSEMLARASGGDGAIVVSNTGRRPPRVATNPPEGGADGESMSAMETIVLSPPVGEPSATMSLPIPKDRASPEGATSRSAETNHAASPLTHSEMPSRDGGESATTFGTETNTVSSPLATDPPQGGGDSGQKSLANQSSIAAVSQPKRRKARAADRMPRGTQTRPVSGAPKRGKPRGDGIPLPPETHLAPDSIATAIAEIVELGTRRRFAIKSQVRIDNALGALLRRMCGWKRPPDDGPERAAAEKANEAARKRAARLVKAVSDDKASDDDLAPAVAPLILASNQGRAAFDALRSGTEKEMRKLARTLPVYAWWGEVKGAGDLGLAIIVAETGDVGSYKSVAAVWKRLGLAVISGERQRKHSDRELAALHGYSPQRRAEIWTLADSLFKHQWSGADEENGVVAHPTGRYGEAYGRKKAEYIGRIPGTEHLAYGDHGKWTPKRADNAARRYMTKCLLRDLYGAWRRAAMVREETKGTPPPAETPSGDT